MITESEGKCNCCSECCSTLVIPARVFDVEMNEALRLKREYLRTIEFNGENYHIMHSVCKLLDNGKCSAYKDRPDACRKFPHGSLLFWKKVCSTCGYYKK